MARRPNVMFSACLCARFQSCPKESYLIAVKHIIRYLKGTIGMDLWYPRTGQFSMMSFSDADYAGCRVNRKSTSETYQFLGNCLVSWSSKKQNFVALSTAMAEYVAAGAYCAQVFWIKHTLLDYDLHYNHIKIFCDNTCLLYTSPSPRDRQKSRMPSSA